MAGAVLNVVHSSSGASRSVPITGLKQEDVDLPTASAVLEVLRQIANQDGDVDANEFSYTLLVEGDESLKQEVDVAREVCQDLSMATSAILHVPDSNCFMDEVDGPPMIVLNNEYNDYSANEIDHVDGILSNSIQEQLLFVNTLLKICTSCKDLQKAPLYNVIENFYQTVYIGFSMGVRILKMKRQTASDKLEFKVFSLVFSSLIKFFKRSGWKYLLNRFIKTGWKDVQYALSPSTAIGGLLPHPTTVLAGSLVVSLAITGIYTGFYCLVKYYKL